MKRRTILTASVADNLLEILSFIVSSKSFNLVSPTLPIEKEEVVVGNVKSDFVKRLWSATEALVAREEVLNTELKNLKGRSGRTIRLRESYGNEITNNTDRYAMLKLLLSLAYTEDLPSRRGRTLGLRQGWTYVTKPDSKKSSAALATFVRTLVKRYLKSLRAIFDGKPLSEEGFTFSKAGVKPSDTVLATITDPRLRSLLILKRRLNDDCVGLFPGVTLTKNIATDVPQLIAFFKGDREAAALALEKVRMISALGDTLMKVFWRCAHDLHPATANLERLAIRQGWEIVQREASELDILNLFMTSGGFIPVELDPSLAQLLAGGICFEFEVKR